MIGTDSSQSLFGKWTRDFTYLHLHGDHNHQRISSFYFVSSFHKHLESQSDRLIFKNTEVLCGPQSWYINVHSRSMCLCGCLVRQRQTYWHKSETHRSVWHCGHCCQWGALLSYPSLPPNPLSFPWIRWIHLMYFKILLCFHDIQTRHITNREGLTTGTPRFIALHFYCASQILLFFFLFKKLKVCGNSSSSKSMGAIFPTAFAHFVPLCHILVILAKFQTLYSKKIMTHWGFWWWLAFFSNTVFLL